MLAVILFGVGFKGASAIAGLFLVAGGYLGYKYGAGVEKRAAAALSKAGQAADSVSKKV
jgi:hypothetical protein